MAEEATDQTIRSGQLDGFYIHIEAKGSIGNNKQLKLSKSQKQPKPVQTNNSKRFFYQYLNFLEKMLELIASFISEAASSSCFHTIGT